MEPLRTTRHLRYTEGMRIELELAPELEEKLRLCLGEDLPRLALEGLAAEGYRAGKLSTRMVGLLLGITSIQADQFLKDRELYLDFSIEEHEEGLETYDRLFAAENQKT